MQLVSFLKALDQLTDLDPVIISYLKEVGPDLSDEMRGRILQEMQSLQVELVKKRQEIAKVYEEGSTQMHRYAQQSLPALRRDAEVMQQTAEVQQAESQLAQS